MVSYDAVGWNGDGRGWDAMSRKIEEDGLAADLAKHTCIIGYFASSGWWASVVCSRVSVTVVSVLIPKGMCGTYGLARRNLRRRPKQVDNARKKARATGWPGSLSTRSVSPLGDRSRIRKRVHVTPLICRLIRVSLNYTARLLVNMQVVSWAFIGRLLHRLAPVQSFIAGRRRRGR